MRIDLPDLPYPDTALEPWISARTLRIHHGKHHRAYVERANALLDKDGSLSLEEVVARAWHDPKKQALFNSAAQAWNHAFYWRSLRPGGLAAPRKFAPMIDVLKAAAISHFASGWVWLVSDGVEMKVMATANADTPIVHGQVPLLAIDVWEHAYYLDRQERRAEYVSAVIDHLLNWEFAASNLERIGG